MVEDTAVSAVHCAQLLAQELTKVFALVCEAWLGRWKDDVEG